MGLSVETEWTFLIRWLGDEGFLSGGMTFDLKCYIASEKNRIWNTMDIVKFGIYEYPEKESN